jgi:hypothetical protein
MMVRLGQMVELYQQHLNFHQEQVLKMQLLAQEEILGLLQNF